MCVEGETVIAAGFPFFSSTLPTITRGNISSVSINMIQTTCCVQSGASGGPIVRPSTCELLGIIVCNVITSTTLYPKLNMAIPASIIKGPIDEYINTGCESVFLLLQFYETIPFIISYNSLYIFIYLPLFVLIKNNVFVYFRC